MDGNILLDLNNDPPIFAGFSRGHGWLSRGILACTGGDVDHAFIIYYSPHYAMWRTVGANADGISFIPLEEFQKTRRIMHLLNPVGFSLWNGMRQHIKDVGTKYDYSGLFGMAFVELAFRLKMHPRYNLFHDKGALFCSMWDDELFRDSMNAIQDGMQKKDIITRWPLYASPPDVIDPARLCKTALASHVFSEEDPSILKHAWVKSTSGR